MGRINPRKLLEGNIGLVFALCASAGLKMVLALSGRVINPDGDDYIWAAQHIMAGRFSELEMSHSPAYSLLIGLSHLVIPDWHLAAWFVTMLLSVLVLIPLYLICLELFNRRTAFWACLLYAISPIMNEGSLEVIREPAYLFFFAWAVYFAVRAIRTHSLRFFLPAAALVWVPPLFREEGVILAPVFTGFILWRILREREGRGPLIKGLSLWLGLPLAAGLCLYAASGPGGAFVEAWNSLGGKVAKVATFEFLDNYRAIYEQLRGLENSSPYPEGDRNLAEIARHFMPVLYLFGLLKSLIKVLFPAFVIPLIWGLRHRVNRAGMFILILCLSYVLMIYIVLIKKDFVQERFLFGAAFLLYPWIGAGMDRITAWLGRISRPRIFSAVFVVLFLILPGYEAAGVFRDRASVIPRAGEWFSERPGLLNQTMVATDSRVPFYAGKGPDFMTFEGKRDDYPGLEDDALAVKAGVLVIRASDDDPEPLLEHYRMVKVFRGEKDSVFIYLLRDQGE